MPKTKLTKLRIGLAFAVAGFADLLQIMVSGLISTPYLWTVGEFADYALDMVTAALTILLLGFHPVLFPAFVLKALQSAALFPTWTACVGYVVWSRKGDGSPEQAPMAAPEKAGDEKPEPDYPAPDPKPAGSGLWILILGAFIICCVLWFRRPPATPVQLAAPAAVKAAPSGAAVPMPDTHGKIIVAVGPMENLSSPNVPANNRFVIDLSNPQPMRRNPQALNPETICSFFEDKLGQIEDVQVLGKEQMRALRGQLADKSNGLSESERLARLRSVLPANIIVLLAILDIHDQKKEFSGYGIKSTSVETTCSVRAQVMNAADGSISFSKILGGSKTVRQADASATSSTEDPGLEAIKFALQKLDADIDFRNAVRGKTSPTPNHTR